VKNKFVATLAKFISSIYAMSPKGEDVMPEAKDPKLAVFELYLATAEKVSDRRAQANAWMLSVNSAIVALYGYLEADKMVVGAGKKAIWLWAIPAAGVIVCLSWAALLASYRKLNRAKFEVLMQLEKNFPVAPFTREQDSYKQNRRSSLSLIETAIPLGFLLLYVVMIGAQTLARDAS